MSVANPSQSLRGTGSLHRPSVGGSGVGAFIRWTGTLWRWSGTVVKPALAIFVLGATAELLCRQAQQYQTALIASVVGQLAAQTPGLPAVAGASTLLNRLLPAHVRDAAILLVAVVVLMALFQFGYQALGALANRRMTAALQSKLHDKLLALGARWHESPEHNTGASIYIVNLAMMVPQSLTLFLKSPFIEGVSLVTASIFIFEGLEALPNHSEWVGILGVVLLLGLPVLAWFFSQAVRRANEAVVAANGGLMNELLNSLSQPLDIETVGGARQRSFRVREQCETLARAIFRTALRSDAANEFTSALPFLLQALFLVYAVVQIAAAGLHSASLPDSLKAIVLIQGLVPQAVQLIFSIITIFTGINEQWPQLSAVGEILDTPAATDPPNAQDWPADAKNLCLENVGFSPGPGLPAILNGIDYEFAPDTITAIAGASGGGKTTLFKLITRVYEPTSGKITVAGTSIHAIKLEALRHNIGIVHQFPPFLSDTVRANFQLASPNATDAQIEAVCRKAGIWDTLVVKNKTRPLDTKMTREAGNNFSGGERRRLAIARGLLNRPSILLFDEPTAGIDPGMLELVADSIRRACAGITGIVIEQNPDFILGVADTVCVLSGGRFVQTGAPREIAEQPGPFHNLLMALRRLAGGPAMVTTSYPMPTMASGPDATAPVGMATAMPGGRGPGGSFSARPPGVPPRDMPCAGTAMGTAPD